MTLDLESINQEAAELEEHYLSIAPEAEADIGRLRREDLEAKYKLLKGAFTLSCRGEVVMKRALGEEKAKGLV